MLLGAFLAVLFVVAGRADARFAIVHLFEWRFDDIAKECEDFLGPMGYAGLQVSPVNEYAVIENPMRPWWERYQPISFRIISRSGDEKAFRDMCSRCNKVGVRVYVDITLNDMSATWPAGLKGTGGSVPDTANKNYPDVPFTAENFHKTCAINNYGNAKEVRECELVGLHDLDQSQEYVRKKMVEFLDNLVDCGASGFRVDAAKHMEPADLKIIFGQVRDLPSGERPLVYQEVAEGGAVNGREYYDIGLVTEFRYGREVSACFKGGNALKWLVNFGEPWGMIKSDKALVFVDNHDTQRDNGAVLTYKDPRHYRMAVGFMFSWGYGTPRVMSSFDFSAHDQGPPADGDYNIKHVTYNADNSCGNGWVCEHRWHAIASMVKFGNVVKGTKVTNFKDNGNKQMSYCRGNKGFAAFNMEDSDMNTQAQTCLPAGTYCDVASGAYQDGKCTGKSIEVGSDGTAQISIKTTDTEGFVAIHLESRIGSTPSPDVDPPPSDNTPKPTPVEPHPLPPVPVPSGDKQHLQPCSVRKAIIQKYDKNYKDFRSFLCQKLLAHC